MPRPKPPHPKILKAFRMPTPMLEAINAYRLEVQAERRKRFTETEAVLDLVKRGLESVGHSGETE